MRKPRAHFEMLQGFSARSSVASNTTNVPMALTSVRLRSRLRMQYLFGAHLGRSGFLRECKTCHVQNARFPISCLPAHVRSLPAHSLYFYLSEWCTVYLGDGSSWFSSKTWPMAVTGFLDYVGHPYVRMGERRVVDLIVYQRAQVPRTNHKKVCLCAMTWCVWSTWRGQSRTQQGPHDCNLKPLEMCLCCGGRCPCVFSPGPGSVKILAYFPKLKCRQL